MWSRYKILNGIYVFNENRGNNLECKACHVYKNSYNRYHVNKYENLKN